MPYYYSREKYHADYDNIDSLQIAVMKDLEGISNAITSWNPNLKPCWTKKNGLGCVFTDVSEEKLGYRIKNNRPFA